MQDKEYTLLTELCDQILLDPKAGINTVAVPWLHVLNEHPSNLEKYSDLFRPTESFIKKLCSSAILHGKCFLRFMKSSRGTVAPQGTKDILFVSHLLNESYLHNPEDFYFGNIQNELKKQGKSSLMMMINHTNIRSSQLNESLRSGKWDRIVFSKYLHFSAEWSIWIRLKKESSRIRKIGHKKLGFEKKFFSECAKQSISPSSFTTLRIYKQLLDVFKVVNPKVVISTFEGHAWERLVFAAAREVNPSILCAGYHHTLMFMRQHAIKRPISTKFDPNVILTAGTITASYLASAASANNWQVKPVGIHRRQSTDIIPSAEIISTKKNYCLVAPDGIISEVSFMFNFAIDTALMNNDITFILRLHPLVSQKDLVRKFPRFGHLPNNVQFSTESLKQDLQHSKWILYRASSTAIYSVLEGVRPIYIARDNEMCIDSLFGLGVWKKTIKRPEEIKSHFDYDINLTAANLVTELTGAFEFCNQYFIPLKKDGFSQVIDQKDSLLNSVFLDHNVD